MELVNHLCWEINFICLINTVAYTDNIFIPFNLCQLSLFTGPISKQCWSHGIGASLYSWIVNRGCYQIVKMETTMLGFFLLCGVLAAHCSAQRVICVTANQTDSSCDQGSDNCYPNCCSLECLENSVINSTTILIQSPSLSLTKPVVLANLTDIKIVGNASRVSCEASSTDEGAGLAFIAVKNLDISNVTFEQCGALHPSTGLDSNQTGSAIYLQSCSNVHVMNVTVRYSNGIGMVFLNALGTVTVQNSCFEHNQLGQLEKQKYSGGGGMYIEFSYCLTSGVFSTNNYSREYNIQNCHFFANEASSWNFDSSYSKLDKFLGLGRGGGLSIVLRGMVTNDTITVSDCEFVENSAVWGGGLGLVVEGPSEGNSISVHDCNFTKNGCKLNGGGGIVVSYQPYGSLGLIPNGNEILFENCIVEDNTANYGGGVLVFIFSDMCNEHLDASNITFSNCTWQRNKANYSAAISTTVYPIEVLSVSMVFIDCKFIANEVQNAKATTWVSTLDSVDKARGIFAAVKCNNIFFMNSVQFENNSGSALYLISSIATFTAQVNAMFVHNQGSIGGAIAVVGSHLQVNERSNISFINNIASVEGGAIYAYSDDISQGCFIHHGGNDTTFSFSGNQAGPASDRGSSMFVTSLVPCVYSCTRNQTAPVTLENAFGCIGEMGGLHTSDVTTTGKATGTGQHARLKVIPGKEFKLPFTVKDELGNEVNSSVYNCFTDSKTDVIVDPAYSYISDQRIKLYGSPEAQSTLTLQTIGFDELYVYINLTIVHCPPGYIHVGQTCVCAWDLQNNYLGLLKCNNSLFQAYVLRGFWAGYATHTAKLATPDCLYTASCPLGYCTYDSSKFTSFYLLPGEASAKALDSFMCGPFRTGLLCGDCAKGRSVYFHSSRYRCNYGKLCNIGWLFYILSELLPLMGIFFAVMFLNVSFTSGAVNGFIFFAQVLDTMVIDANGVAQVSDGIYYFEKAHRFVYGFFNFDFFRSDSLSFCLWDGATTLDMLAFKYVTVAFSLALVCTTVLLLNMCSCLSRCPGLKFRTKKSSIIHGLSAFLVMCYAQSVLVSLQILVSGSLQGLHDSQKVVYYSGNITFFGKDHLAYAIPAILCLITIGAVPPLLLLVYPMGWKVLAICGLSESKGAKCLSVPLEKLKPLLDSFQSCFKDNFRFFAGFYFLYRMSTLITYTFVTNLMQFYIAVEVEVIIILALHSIAQPYQKRWHNIVDTLLFVDLAIINALTLFIYSSAIDGTQTVIESTIIIAASVQAIFTYLPLIYMIGYAILKIVCRVKPVLLQKCFKVERQMCTDVDEFPARLVYPNEDFQYQTFQNLAVDRSAS